MTGTNGHTSTAIDSVADESVRAEGASHVQNIRLEMPPDKLRWQSAILILALSLSMFSVALAWQSEREARLGEYYGIDLEVYIAKQGLHPPADPWRGQPKEH